MFKRFAPVIFILIGLSFFARSIQSQTAPLRPTENLTIKGQIIGAKIFSINARLEQVISLEIKQNGMDVRVKLLDPRGLVVAESDYPFSEQDLERIFVVTIVEGAYRLEIESKFPGETGSIGITLHEVRKSSLDDIKRAEAERLFSQAQSLRTTGKMFDRKKAIEIFEKLLTLQREIDDKTGELRTLAILSYLHRRVGNNEKSVELAEFILRFPDLTEYQTYKSDALYQIAQIQYEGGEIEKAFDSYKKAISVFSEPSPKQVNVFATMAYAYQSIAEFELAQEILDKAVANIRQFPDMYNEAQTFHVFGLYEFNANEFELAIDYFKKAAALRERFGNRQGQAISLTFLGMSYQGLKRFDDALVIFQKSLPVSQEMGDVDNQLDTLIFIAQIQKEKGDVASSLEYYKKGIALFNGEDSTKLRALYLSQGAAYRQLLNFPEARKSLEKAQILYRKTGDIGGEATTLYQLALLESVENQLDVAKIKIERALQIHEYEQAKYKSISRLSSFLEVRRRYFDLYIDILMRMDEQHPGENFAFKALQVNESIRMRTLIWQYREAVRSEPQSVDFQLLSAIQKNQQLLGEQLSLLARAQGHLDKKNKSGDIENTIADLNRQDDSLKARLRLSNPNVANLAQPPTLSLAEMQGELDDETALVEYSLGEERSYLWIVGKNSFQSYVLPKRSEIDAAAKGFYETLSQTTGSYSNRPVSKNIEVSRSNLPQNRDFSAEAEKLSRMLSVEKIAGLPAKRLVVVSDGGLNLIPFSSLTFLDAGNGSRNFLAEKFETVQLPSLTTLNVLRQQNIKPFAPASLAIIADPVFAAADDRLSKNGRIKIKKITENSDLTAALRDFSLTSLSRLPFTRIEAEKIAQNLPDNTSLNLDFRASRERLMNGEFDDYDVLHFATHGFLNNLHPELSGLVLSLVDEKGNSQNGFLRTRDLYLLQIKPQMVVLSACQTGLGKQVENEGLIGLTRGFLATGTPRIVASLWKVDDTATAELMSRFYRAMLKENQNPSAALKTAQNELKAIPRYSHPRYWAGFTLTGEWR